MEARPFFESQIKIKDSSRYLLSKIPVLQQSAVGSSLVGEFSLCIDTKWNSLQVSGEYCEIQDVVPPPGGGEPRPDRADRAEQGGAAGGGGRGRGGLHRRHHPAPALHNHHHQASATKSQSKNFGPWSLL